MRDEADIPTVPTNVRFGDHCLGFKTAKRIDFKGTGDLDGFGSGYGQYSAAFPSAGGLLFIWRFISFP